MATNGVNDAMQFMQASTLLNGIVNQATGKINSTAVDTRTFISQAQTALLAGYDPLINAISQVLSKTIFSIRPYNARFTGLQRDAVEWGNHVRKINFGASGVEDDERLPLTDGVSVDMMKVKKPPVLQTNFYSADVYQNHYTIFRDQLNVAFSGPGEFMSFMSGIVTEVSNKLEQYKENFSRTTLCNLIGATSAAGRVRHLVTEYATMMGFEDESHNVDTSGVLTTYIDGFVKWLFAELKTLSDRFTERSLLYQSNVTGYDILRHTPKDRQRLYLYSPFLAQIDARVLSAVFNPGYLNLGDREEVSFWQSINSPDTIKIQPSVIGSNGAYSPDATTQTLTPVLGILMDYEAAGVTSVNEWSSPTPFNAAGGYSNVYYHCTMRGWNDMTEKAVVLLLD